MKFSDNMSMPVWKLKLLQTRQRKKEEEKRKEREAEEERLRKLPPWKRPAKTVIIIDKDNHSNPVDVAELSKQSSSSNKSKSSGKQTAPPLVNGTAQQVNSGESVGNQGKVGRDEADSGAGGVSEEHIGPVQDNVFRTLERKKRKAPPPPNSGNQINVIASNVSAKSDPIKAAAANSSKKTLPPSGSEAVKKSSGNHIQQPNTLNGPSVIGNQKQSSTKPLSSNEKKTLKEDLPKPKTKDSAPSSSKVGSNASSSSQVNTLAKSVTNTRTSTSASVSSAASFSKDTSSGIKKEETTKAGTITQMRTDPEVEVRGRKKSISELSSLFGGAASVLSSFGKSHPANQTDSKSDKTKSQKASTDSTKVTVSSPSKQSNSTSSHQNVVSTSGQSVKKEDSSKKNVVKSSTTKTEHKSLPSPAKSPSPPSRQKPSSELPASAIISLTNEGPLKNREGQLLRPPSVIDDDEDMTISLESPRSTQSRRSPKASSDAGRDVSNVSNGSPEKRKAPSTPNLVIVNGSNKEETRGASKEVNPEINKVSNTSTNKVEEKKIQYPKNFRDPNFVSKKEETPKKEDIPYPSDFRKPAVAASTSNKNLDSVKPTSSKASPVGESKKEPDVQTSSKKTDQTSSDIKGTDKKVSGETKKGGKTKDSAATLPADGHIPYPDDFRKPKTQQAASKPKDQKRDIVKPSDLIKASDSPSAQKDDNDNDTSGGNMFGFKLRKTKRPESSGINVISQNNDNSKPKVDNAPSSGLIAVGGGKSSTTPKKKNVVKKFEKVDFIGYNSPTGKASALKSSEGKKSKKNVQFSSAEEETFEYMSEEAGITYYDENHLGDEEEGGKKSPQKMQNGIKNGTLDNSYDDEDDEDTSLKSNAPIRSSGGFQNLAAANLSAMDMLLGRGPRPAEPQEPPKPTPPPQQEQEPEDMSLTMDGDLFSSSAGTGALLF